MKDPLFPETEPAALRQRAENMLRDLAVTAERQEDGDALVHELRVHQIELELQNENLRDLNVELEIARDRYSELYEHAPVGYVTLDADLQIKAANAAAGLIIGRQPERLAGVPLGTFIPPESQDDFFLLSRAALSSSRPAEGQIMLRDRPENRWVLLSVGAAAVDGQPEYRVTLMDVTERVQAQKLSGYRRQLERLVSSRTRDLIQALQEKEVLLREVQHRVKNYLQLVSSVLSLEASEQRSARSRAAFRQCQLRVEAMGLVHDLLQRSRKGTVSSKAYVRELAVSLLKAYDVSPGRIRLDLQIDDIPLNLDTAMSVGLILNELITNALQHAFPGARKGTLRISLSQTARGLVSLVVSDDGRGMPEEVDTRSPTSVGLTIVFRLAEQLSGSCTCRRGPGTRFTIRLHPRLERAPRGVRKSA